MMGRPENNFLLPLSSTKPRTKTKSKQGGAQWAFLVKSMLENVVPYLRLAPRMRQAQTATGTAGPPDGRSFWKHLENRGVETAASQLQKETDSQTDRQDYVYAFASFHTHSRWAVSTWRKVGEGCESPGGSPYGRSTALISVSEKKTPLTVKFLAVSKTTENLIPCRFSFSPPS